MLSIITHGFIYNKLFNKTFKSLTVFKNWLKFIEQIKAFDKKFTIKSVLKLNHLKHRNKFSILLIM